MTAIFCIMHQKLGIADLKDEFFVESRAERGSLQKIGIADRMYELRRGVISSGDATRTRNAPTGVLPGREPYLHSATPKNSSLD